MNLSHVHNMGILYNAYGLDIRSGSHNYWDINYSDAAGVSSGDLTRKTYSIDPIV